MAASPPAVRRAAPYLALLPVAVWLIGVFPMDLARVCVGVLLVWAVVDRSSADPFSKPAEYLSLGLLALVPLAVAGHQAARLVAGLHGVDFAIFAQATHAIATTGVPSTSLLFGEPINFLSHHFAPVLYVPGLFALAVPAPLALIGAYALSFGLALAALRRFSIEAGLQPGVATVWTLLVATSPSIRPEMLWGVHDEIFALPFVGWSLVELQRARWGRSLALALAAVCAKESFVVFPLVWLVLAHGQAKLGGPSVPKRVSAIGAALALLWLAGGALYVFAQPYWSGREFDHLGKFDFSAGPSLDALGARALFVLLLLGPFLFLPLRGKAALLWCLPAIPFVVLNLVASDPEMYRPAGYHATIPAFALGFAGVLGLRGNEGRRPVSPLLVLAMLAAQLSYGATTLWRPLKDAVAARWYPAEDLKGRFPLEGRIAADPAAAIALLGHPGVRRLYRADVKLDPAPAFVVAKPGGWEAPTSEFTRDYQPCPGESPWLLLCRSAGD